jgi:hypothetical protein
MTQKLTFWTNYRIVNFSNLKTINQKLLLSLISKEHSYILCYHTGVV